MHYYKFNIADYRKDTAHLTPIEHAIYRELIDWYYFHEKPIPLDASQYIACTPILMSAQQEDIANVLGDFFTKTAHGWTHKRIEKEIQQYYSAKNSHWARNLSTYERCYIQASRNARKKNATQEWLTDEHKKEIKEIYKESQALTESTCIKHEVDHIIPLKGSTVCGLHVPWNLRVIPAYKNREKSNKLEAK